MNNYESILILHALDSSTDFLKKNFDSFKTYYHCFDSSHESVGQAINLIQNLNNTSLIIYLGHGSSYALYIPDESYENEFINITKCNNLFSGQDVILLSCNSKDLLKNIRTTNFAIGFGNIISSVYELDHYNKYNEDKLMIADEYKDIVVSEFNAIYSQACFKAIERLINNDIHFYDIPKTISFLVNKKINEIILDSSMSYKKSLSKLLFDFRDQITLIRN